MFSPLEQFSIINYLNLNLKYIDLTINNSIIYLFISVLLIFFFHKLLLNNLVVLNLFSYPFYQFYFLLQKQFLDVLTIKANHYYSLVNNLFIFLLFNNIIGLIPYSFTTTSQIIITFLFSSTIIIGITFIGIINHNWKFIYLFIPSGIPIFILPLIFLIEIISYLSRILSLSIRLTANMVSGHILFSIISSFSYKLGYVVFVPILFIFYFLELGVAIIQSFVFAILTATYIKDSVLLH